MRDGDGEMVREIVWFDVFPWMNLFRCFRLALETRLMFLAAVAVVLMLSGWAVLGHVFSATPEVADEFGGEYGCPWVWASHHVSDRPGLPPRLVPEWLQPATRPALARSESFLDRMWEPILGTWEQLTRPFRWVLRRGVTLSEAVFLLLAGLWGLAVWSFFGAAITRVAAVEFATGERVSWSKMLGHAARKWSAYFWAPLAPLLLVLGFAAMIWVFGWLLRANLGVLVVGTIWPLLLLAGLAMAVLLLGLGFGWPLMWATISAEGSDSWDALSRSYGYTFQRPFHYFLYVLLAVFVGILSWIIVFNFAAAVIYLAESAAAWSAGAERLEMIRAGSEDLGPLGMVGAWLMRFWGQCVKVFAVGFLYSFFWTAATVMYFLLRRDVDAVELDEVYLDEDAEQPVRGLPPLKTDSVGAPVIDDGAAADSPDAK